MGWSRGRVRSGADPVRRPRLPQPTAAGKLWPMRKLAFVLLAACGGDAGSNPDASTPPPDVAPELAPGCFSVDQTNNDMFSSAADFGAVTPGSLAGWDPNGRWFLTGTRVGGVSSFHFEKRAT